MFRRFWWVLPVMMPVAGMLGLLIAAVSLPKLYESVCVIEVRPLPGHAVLAGGPDLRVVEADLIGRQALEKVVGELDLTSRWGMVGGQAIGTLKRIVRIQRIRGTDLISIRVRHTEPAYSRDIAREVANAYRTHRHGIAASENEARRHELGRAVRDREAKVEELRHTAGRSIGAHRRIQPGLWGRFYDEQSQEAKDAFEIANNLEQEKMEHEVRLGDLLRYKDLQLMAYVSEIDLPDNNFRTLFPEYLTAVAKRKEVESNGLPSDHPSALAADEQVERLRRECDEAVVKIRGATEIQLGLVSQQLDSIELMKAQAIAAADELRRQTEIFKSVTQELDVEKNVLQKLKVKLIAEETAISYENVIVHFDPVIPEASVRRNLAFGGVAGILISPLLALPLMWLLNRRR